MQNVATALHPSRVTNPALGELGVWRWLREQVSYLRSMSELNRLDDKTLDDIGVSRDRFPPWLGGMPAACRQSSAQRSADAAAITQWWGCP